MPLLGGGGGGGGWEFDRLKVPTIEHLIAKAKDCPGMGNLSI